MYIFIVFLPASKVNKEIQMERGQRDAVSGI